MEAEFRRRIVARSYFFRDRLTKANYQWTRCDTLWYIKQLLCVEKASEDSADNIVTA